MKNPTKLMAVTLCAAICLSFTSCSKKNNGDGTLPSVTPPQAPSQGGINPTAPIKKYDFNPLTGTALPEGYTVGQRPVAIMIGNSPAAMPQRGIGSADAIYEMVTEGGVTRLMAMYADYRTVPQVGPVRSARDAHLQFALPMNSIFVHIGSSIYADNLLNQYQYKDLDGVYLGWASFAFDTPRNISGKGNEHCWFTDGPLLTTGMEKSQIAVTGAYESLFKFNDKDSAPRSPAQGDAGYVKWSFANGSDVDFTYDAATGLYLKTAFGAAHIDELTGAQLGFNNVFLLSTTVGLKPDAYCTDFDLSQGTGFYISNGKYESITWKKGLPEAPIRIYDANGQELVVNVGKSYVGVIGSGQIETLQLEAAVPAPPAPAAE